MPRPAKSSARPRHTARARQVLDRKPRAQGWRSTDEEEVERRRQRAAAEPVDIEAAEARHLVFGTYQVGFPTGGLYRVEIRALSERVNSCSCPDHRINRLGTCKHVEAVLAWLLRRRRARPRRGASAAAGSQRSGRVEIFLDRRLERPEIRVQWPAGGAPDTALRALLGPFLAAGGQLRRDPLTALPELARKLALASRRVQARVRLSRELQPWLEEERRKAARGVARSHFLAEVEAGRRSMDLLALPLYPYQREGMLHLAFTERALLADEMGLGKTAQAIAACELLRQIRGIERVLVVSPASLKAEWEEQIEKFSHLPARIIQGPRALRLRQYAPGVFFYLANYEQIRSDGEEIQRHLAPDVIVLDEAQRIKNWQSKTAQAVKRLHSPYAFVLTGTPIENRIDELYSLVQFLDPALLGPLFRFNREFYELDDRGRPSGLKNLDELHRRIAGILLRRRKDEVEDQLPGRTVNSYFLPMEPEQIVRYAEYEQWVAQLLAVAERRPLTPDEFDQLQSWLACMRMLCDTPYILDPDCRICPKLSELEEILAEQLAEPDTKILVFSEWERMLALVRELAEEMDVEFAWHTGSVPQQRRRREIRRFKDDRRCRLFLSTDSGGLGLNLQAATS
jgi:SNF2 family DNA or RNA helicase